MELFSVIGAEGYELCHPIDEKDFETINVQINGIARGGDWQSPVMRLINKDDGRLLRKSDSPWLGSHALILRESAVAAVSDYLQASGELLRLFCPGANLRMLNVTRVIPALDEASSDLRRFNDGHIMYVRRYVFLESVVGDADVFKVSGLRVSPTFVSRRFVDAWASAELSGLEFKPV